MRYVLSFVLVVTVMMASGVCEAQTGAGLMQPFAEGEAHEFSGGFMVGREGNVEAGGVSGPAVRWTRYDSRGRMNLSGGGGSHGQGVKDAGDDDPIAQAKSGGIHVGFRSRHIELDTTFAGLPERMSDHAVAVGFELGTIEGWGALDGFDVSATLGVGYAGTTAFSDGDAYYGIANVMATKRLNERSWLTLVLNYDGHRSFLPDVPLPGVMFRQYITRELSYTVGFPFSGITWEPNEKLKMELRLLGISTIEAKVAYELFDELSVFGHLQRDTTTAMIDSPGPKRRLFFEQSRIEAGLRWRPSVGTGGINTEVTVAGGYAFSQEFTTGWDTRDDVSVVDLSDEPFVRVAARFGF